VSGKGDGAALVGAVDFVALGPEDPAEAGVPVGVAVVVVVVVELHPAMAIHAVAIISNVLIGALPHA
jgi:hypothetical protein